MSIYKIGEFTLEIEFIREKYGCARWDYSFKKDDKEFSWGCNRSTLSFDEKDAIIEILMEDKMINKEIEEELAHKE